MKRSPVGILLGLLLVVTAVVGFSRVKAVHTGLGTYPEIFALNAQPEVIQPGDFTTISWSARGAASVTLESTPDNAGPEVTRLQKGLPPVGSMKVQVRETTNYVLRCETVFSGAACMPGRVVVEVKKK
jgi:hypothetical protein